MINLLALIFRWWWLGLLSILLLSFLMTLASEKLSWLEVEYASTTIIEIRPIADGDDPVLSRNSKGKTNPELMTRAFMNRAFDCPVVTPFILEMMMVDDDLVRRIGSDKRLVLMRMKKMVSTHQDERTGYQHVSVKSNDPELSKDLLTALLKAYAKRRKNLILNVREMQLKAIKVEWQNKSERVKELQERIDEVARKGGGAEGEVKVKYAKLVKISKKDYEIAVAIRDLMKKKYQMESSLPMEGDSLIIHQAPQLPTSPVSYQPHIRLALILLPLTTLISYFVIMKANRLFPRTKARRHKVTPRPDF